MHGRPAGRGPRRAGRHGRHLIVHVAEERERALAEHRPTPRASWEDAADGLVDAIVGLWLAPVTPRGGGA